MKTVITASWLFLLPSVLGGVCREAAWGFTLCTENDTLTQVTHDSAWSAGKYLSIDLPKDTIIGPEAFKTLDLEILTLTLPDRPKESRHLLTLLPNSFAAQANLTNLTIQYANIQFDKHSLAPLRSLINFECRYCNFSAIPTELLSSAPNLERLSLQDNQIKMLRQRDFVNLKHLRCLKLVSNLIVNIEPGCFKGLDLLTTLDLSFNAFPAVPRLLSGLGQLKRLRMYKAFDSTGFSTQILEDVPLLYELQLGGDNFSTLTPGMFDAVPNLGDLTIYGSKIRVIPKGVFEHLQSLKEVNLADNVIEDIAPGAFGKLRLGYLNLSINRARKVIKANTFQGLIVRTLLLGGNEITTIEPNAFKGFRATWMLDLTDNLVRDISVGGFDGLITKDLDLSGNPVADISKDAFREAVVNRLGLFRTGIKEADKAKWGLDDSVEIMM